MSNNIIRSDSAYTASSNTPGTEYYELKVYTFTNEKQQKLVEDFYNTAIPALNRLRVKNVGVFTELVPASLARLYVFIPYGSLEHFAQVKAGLERDELYQQNAAAYLFAPATAPAYEKLESSLMKAFKNFPEMIVPKKQDRIFELRQYQSPGEAAGKKKIEMFNDQGEIDIFKRLQFHPVFWGETIIGQEMPNLTYMVTFDDLAAKESLWATFIDDAQWKEVSVLPGYSDELLIKLIVSTVLIPTSNSQI